MHDRPFSPQIHSGFFSRFWRCSVGFWRGRGATQSWALTSFLAIVVVLGLLVQYWLNLWNRDFFNALERKDAVVIGEQALLFLVLAGASMTLAIVGVWGA